MSGATGAVVRLACFASALSERLPRPARGETDELPPVHESRASACLSLSRTSFFLRSNGLLLVAQPDFLHSSRSYMSFKINTRIFNHDY